MNIQQIISTSGLWFAAYTDGEERPIVCLALSVDTIVPMVSVNGDIVPATSCGTVTELLSADALMLGDDSCEVAYDEDEAAEEGTT